MAKKATVTPLDEIKWEPKIYPRGKWETSTVARYAEALDVGDVFPPIVIEDNPDDPKADGRLLDGKHRLEAHRKAGRTEISAERHKIPEGMGAKYYAATLSARHGDRMSLADLKRLARECFDPKQGGDPTQNVSAWGRHLGLANQTVFGWVGDIVNKGLEDRRAKVMRLTRLGWSQAEIAALLDVSQQTVSGDTNNPESGISGMRDAMVAGLPEAEAAKRWNLPVVLAHAVKLDGLDDATRMDRLGIKVQPYDVWNWSGCHDLMGDAHPGRIPGELVCHLLYFLTKPGDLVVDPMVGSGTTLDACLLMGRKARGYDIDHRHEAEPEPEEAEPGAEEAEEPEAEEEIPPRVDIEHHDLSTGWPDTVRKADLIVWDPPYFDKMDHSTIGAAGYVEGSISGLDPDGYLDWLGERFDQLAKLAKPGAKLAFIMSDWTSEHAKHHAGHRGIFLWDYANRMTEAGLRVTRQIQAPLPIQLIHPDIVLKFRESRRLARLNHYVLIAEA